MSDHSKTSSICIAIAAAAAFWTIDAALVGLLDKERLGNLVLRNVVLAGLIALAFVVKTRSVAILAMRDQALWFVLGLWIAGAVANSLWLLSASQETIGAAMEAVLYFPLTTLEVATYSGILPAVLFGTIAPLVAGRVHPRRTK